MYFHTYSIYMVRIRLLIPYNVTDMKGFTLPIDRILAD